MSDVHLNHPQTGGINSLKTLYPQGDGWLLVLHPPRRVLSGRKLGRSLSPASARRVLSLFSLFFSSTSTSVIAVWDGTLSPGCSHQHGAITHAPRGADKNTHREWTRRCQVMAARLRRAHIKQTRAAARRRWIQITSAQAGPGEQTAPRIQTGTLGFVSPLTCERNQPQPPSPHYSGQPGWSNNITKNISPVWLCLCVWAVTGFLKYRYNANIFAVFFVYWTSFE